MSGRPSPIPNSTGETARIRVIVVDDHYEFLDLVTALLCESPGVDVVGACRSGLTALEKALQIHPDLVVTDLGMPFMDGIELTRCIKEQPNAPRVAILAWCNDPHLRSLASQVGADSYILKSDFNVELLPQIRRMFAAEPQAGARESSIYPTLRPMTARREVGVA